MADIDSPAPKIEITTNRGGQRVFRDLHEVRGFSVSTAIDVATLTAILRDSEVDDVYMDQMLELLNDLSYQLQQAVELMCDAEHKQGEGSNG